MLFLTIVHAAALAGQAASPPGPATPAKAEAERPICQTSVETGSHARRRKVCMTRRQWTDLHERSQAMGQGMQQLIGTEQGR